MEKCRSIFGAGEIKPHQLILEILCKKYADWKQVKLPQMFWKKFGYDFYVKKFRIDAPVVLNLLKQYDADIIISALHDKRAKYIVSIRNTKLIPLLNVIKAEKEYQQTHKKNVIVLPTDVQPTRPKKTNKLDKLRD